MGQVVPFKEVLGDDFPEEAESRRADPEME